MQSDNRQPGNSSSKILPLAIAAFAGATLAIACERPASRVASEGYGQDAAASGERARATAQHPAEAAPPAPPASTPLPPREALTDSAIAGRIADAIERDPGMAGADISVNSDRGAVTLVGSVANHEQIALASAHAQRQDGITRVDNHLGVPAQ